MADIVVLQRHADQANQMEISNSFLTLTNNIIYMEAGTYNGICWTGDFRNKTSGTQLASSTILMITFRLLMVILIPPDM